MHKFFGFPGGLDLFIFPILYFAFNGFEYFFTLVAIVAIIRIAIYTLIRVKRFSFSSAGLRLDFIIALMAVLYLFVWPEVNIKSASVTYLGIAAGAEFLIVIFISKLRSKT